MLNLPLKDKIVVVTGTSRTTTVLSEIEALGGRAAAYPLIEIREIIEPNDSLQLEKAKNVDWLIFTSQNAVEIFCNKLRRCQISTFQLKAKIAAVGEKTAKILESNQLHVDFMPSVYSADIFVKEFPVAAGYNPTCLFIRGKKAKDTLKAGLPFAIQEWNVYDTYDNLSSIKPLIDTIQSNEEVIVIFASPSAVDVFAKFAAPIVGWTKAKYAAIGHITAARIKHYGAHVTYKPNTYTMQAVLDEIQNREDA
ncbi:uroporphyrinogen-III synthase [Lysinibacillus telephonicus]|uniref:Uroporphyrinogen-III synthase n=1 Tax=Lysinibacillus telephonicus TaxID=1714840 RepID=A0A3S0JZ67_9BACI|nr:uroporphyrinogen-III synthase [Lysinibacillus telephonicus]RTQ95807.1 uroporphyrinogen-III synthase [Lysinibacillus telephonicus]